MKASDLPKDDNGGVRINKKLKKLLKEDGMSIQKIVDQYLDRKYKVPKTSAVVKR